MTIDLLPSPEQEEVIASARGVFTTATSRSDRDRWLEYAKIGAFGLGIPEALGGAGFGLVEEALVLREAGRDLTRGPLLASILGARVAAFGGANDLAAAIISGEARVTWARHTDDGHLLVFDGADATHLLIVGDDLAALHDVPPSSERRHVECIDPTVGLESCTWADRAPCAMFADDNVARRALVLFSALFAGIAERGRDLSTAYACEREQFGRPIGVNQAVKHRCADMAVRCEAAASQLFLSALHVDGRAPGAELDALAAVAVASDAAFENARATVQIHGGLGFTTEHVAHLLVKRSHVVDRMLGGTAAVLARILDAEPG